MSYSVVTTVLSAAASTLLTDLATVKDELSLTTADTSNDAWLTRAISQVSRTVQRHCKRIFVPEYVQDVFDIEQDPYPYQTPGGFPQLQLSRWPVLGVVSVIQLLAPASSANGSVATTQTLNAGTDFRVDPKTGQLLRLNPFTGVATLWEALPVTVLYTAGFGDLVLETDTVPSSPYQITVTQADAFSCAQTVTYPNGTALTQVASAPAPGQFSVANGVYTFNPADSGQVLSFAYATSVPDDDLVAIVLRLITTRFSGRGRDAALIQRETPGVGVERFWFGGAPGQKGQFPPDIEAALADFRVPTAA